MLSYFLRACLCDGWFVSFFSMAGKEVSGHDLPPGVGTFSLSCLIVRINSLFLKHYPVVEEEREGCGTLCHSVEIPSGCFPYQDIGSVSRKAPASKDTYWITDNLGMDMTSSEGVKEKIWVHWISPGCVGLFRLPQFSIHF